MAYTPPPTFVNDNVLSASQLNILSDDIEYLRGQAGQINLPTPHLNLKDNADYTWAIRHKHRYLVVQFKYFIDSSKGTQWTWDLDYGSNASADSATYTTPTDTWQTVTRTIDLDALTSPPTVGTWYEITLTATWDGTYAGNAALYLLTMYEKE